MQDEKSAKIIEAVQTMTDREVGILAVFIAELRAGRQGSSQQ